MNSSRKRRRQPKVNQAWSASCVSCNQEMTRIGRGQQCCDECLSIKCECGEKKELFLPACERCMRLDGILVDDGRVRRGTGIAQDVLGILRNLGRCSWDSILDSSSMTRRNLHRGMAVLREAGRVKRYEIEGWYTTYDEECIEFDLVS